MTEILLAIQDSLQREKFEDRLKDNQYSVACCKDYDSMAEAFRTRSCPDIVVLDSDLFDPSIANLCRNLRYEDEEPAHIVILASKEKFREISAYPDSSYYDFLIGSCDEFVLEEKIRFINRMILEKRADRETKVIMDRYVRYVESLARERKDQLFHLDCLSTIGIMAAGIAHEVNNSLAYALVSVESIEKYWNTLIPVVDEVIANDLEVAGELESVISKIPEAFERVHKGIRRVQGIVKGSRIYAKQSNKQKQLCRISDCVDDAIEICTTGLGCKVKINCCLDRDNPEVLVNSAQIVQVLVNLVVNAGHAMEGQTDGRISISSKIEGQQVALLVDDTGPGIPNEQLEQIWQAFYTTKGRGKGTGLGLAICREIIQEHGGTITAENRTKGGARFVVYLPVYKH